LLPVIVGTAIRPFPGQKVSGDACVVAPFNEGVLVAAIDGLGHGRDAAEAAEEARQCILGCADQNVITIVNICHESLRKTRGAVMSLASFNGLDNTMTWIAVGNVEGYFASAQSKTGEKPCILMRGGVVGGSLPPLRAEILSVAPGDTMVMATDGIRSGFSKAIDPGMDPQKMADEIMAEYAKDNDDALVLAVRWLGGRK
jgi:phosphoserine phosphatase RsbX